MKKPIKVYAEQGHAAEKDWLRHLVHPIRAHWGDGTPEWRQWEKDFDFYKILFLLTDSIAESDVVFLPMTFNYYANKGLPDLLQKFRYKGMTEKFFKYSNNGFPKLFIVA